MASQLCIALDGSDRGWITRSARSLEPAADWFKIGLEAFTAHGPDLVRDMAGFGRPVFLDLKFHDIPNTVARAAANAARAGAAMLNVHAAGGRAMMEAAVQAVREVDPSGATRVIAVTVLTSLDGEALAEMGQDRSPETLALEWARFARDSGLDGVVASARDAEAIRRACGPEFLIVTPGIRPRWAAGHDQRRTVTPQDAVAAGADVLVVGRPITTASDPASAAAAIAEEMRGG